MEEQKQTENSDFFNLDLPSYEGNEPYLFVSYSHKDTDAVRKILRLVDHEKFRFWYDDTMEIGEDFRAELRTRIEDCSGILLFISDASMSSKYCGMEIITAFKNDKKIYPIYLRDDIEIPAPLKMILENIQHVKGVNSENPEKYFQKLIAGLPTETMRSFHIEGNTLIRCKDGSTTLNIPDEVTTIGAGAFKNCEKLVVLDIGSKVEVLEKEACRGCKSLRALTLPQNVRKVGESAFRDCISLTSLVIENEEIELGERAFENCANLSKVTLTDGMTEIYGGVFNSCKSLTHITLPSKLTILGESSFADCIHLEKIDIPEQVTKIDDMCFNGCLSLERVQMQDRVTKIGKNAFKDCKSLTAIQIPASVSSIGSGLFRGCTNLSTIEVDSKNKHLKAVDNILFNKNKSVLFCYPAQTQGDVYTIPDSVTLISDWAFSECTALHEVKIPDSVYEIGEGGFYFCSSLRSLTLPDSVIRIDDVAFRGCSSLETIVIPDSVIDFGWGVFNGCDNITVICNNHSKAAHYCDLKNIPHHEA